MKFTRIDIESDREMVANKWITHVKKMAKKLKINYSEAIGDPRVKRAYKPVDGAKRKKRRVKRRK